MYKGTVTFSARIAGKGLTFPLCEVTPHEPGIDKIELTGPTGDDIRSTVYLSSVATPDEGRRIATNVNTAALDRLAFFHDLAIDNAQLIADDFAPLAPQQRGDIALTGVGVMSSTGTMRVVIGYPAARIKTELEQASPSGERMFGLFRSARQSQGHVEEFMHLYNLVLMLLNDSQGRVDNFIRREEPNVQQAQHPRHARMETVYTRLRNEFAHAQPGVNVADAKAEMAHHLGGLLALTKRAIEVLS
jgi:hypothetical protein